MPWRSMACTILEFVRALFSEGIPYITESTLLRGWRLTFTQMNSRGSTLKRFQSYDPAALRLMCTGKMVPSFQVGVTLWPNILTVLPRSLKVVSETDS